MYDPQFMRGVLVALVQVIPTLVLAYAVIERPRGFSGSAYRKRYDENDDLRRWAKEGLAADGVDDYDRDTYARALRRAQREAKYIEADRRTLIRELLRFLTLILIAVIGLAIAVSGSLRADSDAEAMQLQLGFALIATFWVAIEVGIAGLHLVAENVPTKEDDGWMVTGLRIVFWFPAFFVCANSFAGVIGPRVEGLYGFLRSVAPLLPRLF